MPQSLSKVYVHLTFSTKERHPFIDDDIKERLWSYLGGICKGLECNPIQIGGYSDHIHILCILSKKITQIKMIEENKKQSSKWVKSIGSGFDKFYWQNAFALSGLCKVLSSFRRALPHANAQRPLALHLTNLELRTLKNKFKKIIV